MSRGMKIYAALLVTLGGFIVFNIFYEPSDVRALNATLKQDEQLSSYPYTFRVLRLKDGVATMTSPRSASVPVPMIISVIEPALSGISVNDERFFAAQQRLADMQSRAHTEGNNEALYLAGFSQWLNLTMKMLSYVHRSPIYITFKG